MSDLELVVRVRADGSGLVGQLGRDRAAIDQVTAATDRASASARSLASSSGQVSQAGERMGGAIRKTTQSIAEQRAQLRANADAIGQVVRATNPAVSSQAQLDAAVRRVQAAFIQGKVGAETYARAQQIAARATAENVQWQQRYQVSAGQARMGTMMLGQQIQDIGMQLALGTNIMRVFAMQAGQTALAVQQMGGAGAGVARFIGGPWGSLILAGVSVLAMMTMGLNDNASASRNAMTASDALGRAQGALGDMFDLSTGKIRQNTEALRLNILMQAQQMRFEAQRQRAAGFDTLRGASDLSWTSTLNDLIMRISPVPGGDGAARQQQRNVQSVMRDMARARAMPAGPARDRAMNLALLTLTNLDTTRLATSGLDLAQAGIDIMNAGEAERIADAMIRSASSGQLDPSLRRDQSGGGRPRPRDTSAAEARLAEFGRDAAMRINELTLQFQDTPAQADRVTRALNDLDDLLEDIERRRPPDFQRLLEQGRAAREVIEDGINKPFRDWTRSQQEALRIGALQAQGREDEAEALRITFQLQKQIGDLLPEQEAAILAGVQATRLQQREMQILRDQQRMFLDALGQTRDLLTSTVRGVLDGDLRAIRDLPGRLRKVFNDLLSRYLTENLFGGAFRELEDRITGNNIAREAAYNFRDAVAVADQAARGAAEALNQLADAARGVAPTDGGDQEIVITGMRGQAPLDPRRFFEDMITRLAEGILGRQAAQVIGQIVSRGLEGAAYGSMAGSLISGLLGGRQSQSGAAIGGAIGNIAGEALKGGITRMFGSAIGSAAGPIGSIIGGIAGSLLGGLLGGSKRGSASITSVDGPASVSGNSSSFRSAASGMAGNVQDALQAIAEQLGGGVGSFAVSIGVRDGKFRVDPTGQGNTKKKKSVDFGDDQAAAIAFAIADAIADGAITGLSSAVQAALRSSTDVNKALREALKVDELETLLSGTDGALNKAFKDFERQAAERVRIARKYGFDLVKLEELNAKERAKLLDDILKARVGSLQQLLDSLDFGDLFEGSIAEQRSKLLVEVAKAEEAAKAGEEGAADRVADLRRQLLDLTRSGFGTAGGEYAADRAATRSAAEEIIRLENERVKAAQEAQLATNAHLVKGNDLANEGNNLLAEQNAILRAILYGGGGGGGFGGGDFGAARDVSFL